MATTRVSILSGDGRTGTNVYATFSAWVASLPASLITADTVEQLRVEHKAGGHSISAATAISNTTDATRYIELVPETGHGHSGVADTNKAHFVGTVSASNTCLLQMQTNRWRIQGLQFFVVSTGASSVGGVGAWSTGTNAIGEIDRCIVNCKGGTGSNRAIWASSTGSGAKNVITNTLIHEQEYASNTNFLSYEGVYHNAGDLVLLANTFARCGSAINTTSPAGKTIHARGNLVYGTGSQAAYSTAPTIMTAGSGNNAFSMSIGWGVSGDRLSQTFSFKAAGSYKLAATDAGARDFGADLSADAIWPLAAFDGGGQARTGTWDIGADELDPAGSITFTGPAASTIGRGGKMTFTGTYTGTSAGLQFRLVQAGTTTVLSGFDWASAGGSFSSGSFSFAVASGIPDGGWYECQCRFVDDTAVTATSSRFGEGWWILNGGQSNGLEQAVGSAYAGVTADDKLRIYGVSVTAWSQPTAVGICETGNALLAANGGIPVLIIQGAVGGTSLASWQPGQTYYNQLVAQVTALSPYGAGADGMLFDQGEYEAQNGTTFSTHSTGLTNLTSAIRTAMGAPSLPLVLSSLSSITSPFTSTDANWGAVNRAIKTFARSTPGVWWVNRADLPNRDGVHLPGADQQTYGKRRGVVLKAALGLAAASTANGPRIRKINRESDTSYLVLLTPGAGTDITPSSGITGWTVEDPSNGNAPLTVASVARVDTNSVRITLATGPLVSGTQVLVSYLRGPAVNTSAPVRDNTAVPLPVDYEHQWLTRTLATTVAFAQPFENGSGAAPADATGLKWAYFKEPTVDTLTTAAAKGSGAALTAGVLSGVTITAADEDVGELGYLLLTNGDGTTTQSPPAKGFQGTVVAA